MITNNLDLFRSRAAEKTMKEQLNRVTGLSASINNASYYLLSGDTRIPEYKSLKEWGK